MVNLWDFFNTITSRQMHNLAVDRSYTVSSNLKYVQTKQIQIYKSPNPHILPPFPPCFPNRYLVPQRRLKPFSHPTKPNPWDPRNLQWQIEVLSFTRKGNLLLTMSQHLAAQRLIKNMSDHSPTTSRIQLLMYQSSQSRNKVKKRRNKASTRPRNQE